LHLNDLVIGAALCWIAVPDERLAVWMHPDVALRCSKSKMLGAVGVRAARLTLAWAIGTISGVQEPGKPEAKQNCRAGQQQEDDAVHSHVS
jgi:hypothetical protein